MDYYNKGDVVVAKVHL